MSEDKKIDRKGAIERFRKFAPLFKAVLEVADAVEDISDMEREYADMDRKLSFAKGELEEVQLHVVDAKAAHADISARIENANIADREEYQKAIAAGEARREELIGEAQAAKEKAISDARIKAGNIVEKAQGRADDIVNAHAAASQEVDGLIAAIESLKAQKAEIEEEIGAAKKHAARILGQD